MEPALLTKMEGVKTSGTDCRRYKVLPKVWKCAQPEIRVEDSRYFQTFQEKLRDHRAGLEWRGRVGVGANHLSQYSQHNFFGKTLGSDTVII